MHHANLPTDVDHILVEMPKLIGDCINATPALQILRQAYPQARITLLIQQPAFALFSRDLRFEVYEDQRRQQGVGWVLQFIHWCRSAKPQMGIALNSHLVGVLMMKLGGVGAVFGYHEEGRGLLLHNPRIRLDRSRHYINRYAYIANLAVPEPVRELPALSVYAKPDQAFKQQFTKRVIGLYIGGKNKGARHYPVEKLLDVFIPVLAQSPMQLVLVGTQEERAEADQLVAALHQHGFGDCVVNLVGETDLTSLLDKMAVMDGFISIDSSPLHMAAALELPTVALVTKGTSAFSVVRPKSRSLWIAESEGRYIYDDDQAEDLYPPIVRAHCLDMLSHLSSHAATSH